MSIGHWTFLSNHTHVVICIARTPDIRVREIAGLVGLTERAVLRIISELEDAGVLAHERVGRRNRYRVAPEARLRHPLEAGVSLGQLLGCLLGPGDLRRATAGARGGATRRARNAGP